MSETAGAAVPVIEHPADPLAASRSRLYALFAEAFSYPTGAVAARLLGGGLLADLAAAGALLTVPLAVPAALTVASGEEATTETQILYTGLFDVGTVRPVVSMLERRYGQSREPDEKLWEDLLRFYKFFGLDFSRGRAAESPDHLLTELDFMHYLVFLETGAHRGHEDLRRGQADFLDRHLGRWTGAFATALAAQEETGPYAALAAILDEFVTGDRRHLEECRT